MEKRTSKVFKQWMTYAGHTRGGANSYVTYVNNEIGRTTLQKDMTIFDSTGRLVYDLKFFQTHFNSIVKHLNDNQLWVDTQYKCGVDAFASFLKWLFENPTLDTYDKITEYLDAVETVNALSFWKNFIEWLKKKFGSMTGNACCIVCRVKRVLKAASHTERVPTADEIDDMIRNISSYVENPGSAADCQVALRHLKKALYGEK